MFDSGETLIDTNGLSFEQFDELNDASHFADVLADIPPFDHESLRDAAMADAFTPEVLENWAELAPEQREQVAEQAVDNLSVALGLNDIQVNFKDMEPGLYGTHTTDAITINSRALNDTSPGALRELTDTIAHETYHQLQQEAVENPDKFGVSAEQANAWRDNYDNYWSQEDDPQAYREQPLEASAWAFGEGAADALGLAKQPVEMARVSVTATPNGTAVTYGNDSSAWTVLPNGGGIAFTNTYGG